MVREPSNRANIELVTIYEISKILSSSLDLSKTFHEVLNLLAAHLEIRRGLVILKHEDGALHLFSAVGLSRDEYDRGTYQLGEGIIGRILRAGMAVVVPDLAQEPLFLNRTGALDEKADAAVALIGVPIKAALGLIVPVKVITPPAPTARSLTVQAKFGPALVWVMRTPLPTVLLVTRLMVTLTGMLSRSTTPLALLGPVLVKGSV